MRVLNCGACLGASAGLKIVLGLCGVAGAMSNWMLGKGADAGDKLIEVRFLI